MAAETIGFVGTGRMGGPMAGRLLDAGYSLCIYDAQPDATKELVARGARLAKSPAEVASSADIVLGSLPTPDIVKAVTLGADGIIAGNRATIFIDLSTTGPGAAKMIAQGFAAYGDAVFDKLRCLAQCQRVAFDRVGGVRQINVICFLQGEQRRSRNRAHLVEPLFLRGDGG